MDARLSEALARLPQWAQAEDRKVTPLGGGITNYNYRLDVGGQAFVVRIGGANTDLLGIDRENEHAANAAAAEIGVAPEVVAFLAPEGYLVTRFLDKAKPIPPEEMRRPETIRRVAATLKRIHAMRPIPGTFSPFRVVDAYASTARRYGVPFPTNFDWLLERSRQIEAAFETHPITPQPCHNDLLNGNFLDDGNIRILDWEYAGMGDITFDLANFAINHEFGDEEDHVLLESYFGEVTPSWWARLKLMKRMSDFREAMWGLLQQGISQLDFDFREYAEKHFARMTEGMNHPSWNTWLTEAAHGS